MILSRVLSFVLRFLEVVCALVSKITNRASQNKLTLQVVTAASGWFLHIQHTHQLGPKGRLIFTIAIGLYSLVLSLIWLLPFTSTFLHYPLDFITSFCYFTVYAILQEWIHHYGCGRVFQWNGEYHMGECIDYRVMEAFAFIGGVFWLISALLVCLISPANS